MLLPDWARAYEGATVVIAASGPSQRKEDLDYARGKAPVWVINTTWRLAPWADVLYACDALWWQKYGPAPGEFPGRKVHGHANENVCTDFCAMVVSSDKMIWDGKKIGGLANSGAQVVNLLTFWRARRLILTGFDFSLVSGVHWHGPHEKRPNPQESSCEKWLKFMKAAAPEIAARGTEIINCSRETALDCFPKMSLEDALDLEDAA